ncbi:MAG TPA: ParB/RepB/Spo0J family partition protein [Candidatus Paceibacterota bacterium]|jgi:ParB family chromosome partitioning protein|nr:ParB/RepB/Spo0J family partition protein [Candidatus Paceibacterota bacterium]HOH11248.1 ParB/RepB/Spo0J family partition protein [Candidatus Paceibacterota bacterium]HOY11164.1 ParB/RepB/Spo0J family partition protein [Candidatus Paceibacterota bacterium]HPB60448.1 ParB/RepB/Spo0J family partition protein [Candidatus Paceibacterota bacterium]HPI24592.1 ParB/RepB/Spo0J family partition protein [Candidatus Paceibacterota bacterium]
MPGNYEDKIFLIEVEKIKPNPFQPRSEFNNERLRDLADSIRQYGVLQPLVVTRNEVEREDGSLYSEYELIAGERRWRASQLAGLKQVPAVIRTGAQSDKEKLEMAIIENLQREDLNPIERAQAFFRLIKEFNLTHAEVAKRIGRSREYVSNTVRILNLPQEMLDALVSGKINEGHTRPLLMLSDRPHEQVTIFKEIIFKRLNVRDTENIARRIAFDKVRKIETLVEPEILELEEQLTEKYGNRVTVEKKEKGGRVMIDWASEDDLKRILKMMCEVKPQSILEVKDEMGSQAEVSEKEEQETENQAAELTASEKELPTEGPKDDEENLYFIKNFSV